MFWRLSRTCRVDCGNMRSTNVAVDVVRVYHPNGKPISRALYVVDCTQVRQEHLISGTDDAFLFYNVGEEGIPFVPTADFCCLVGPIDDQTLLERVFDVWSEVSRWDMRLGEAVLAEGPSETLFSIGPEMLRRPFGIHDVSLKIVYRTSGFIDDLNLTEESPDYQRMVRAHTLESDFHEGLLREGPFMYHDKTTDSDILCVNMFYEKRFVARLLVPIHDSPGSIDPGEAQLFAVYAHHVEEAYRHGSDAFLPQRRNEAMHDVFRDMANGRMLEPPGVNEVLSASGWSRDQSYVVIVFKLHAEPGWVARGDVSRAYLCRTLEWEWPQSCAVEHGDDIAWVINLDLTGVGVDDYGLFQSLAAFVRDNVCNAGVSRRFTDFMQFSQAVKQSDIALSIGMIRHPHFWYYPFDDYKLEYLRGKMVENISAPQLSHPAIQKLQEYDEEKGTELTGTLECYLDCEQNAATASERMFVHRSTFFRRLEYIRELTNVDLDDPQEVLYLRLSYWLLS